MVIKFWGDVGENEIVEKHAGVVELVSSVVFRISAIFGGVARTRYSRRPSGRRCVR